MKSIIKQLYTILLVTVACLTATGCSDDFKSNLRLDHFLSTLSSIYFEQTLPFHSSLS